MGTPTVILAARRLAAPFGWAGRDLPCDNPATMTLDDRFDELAAGLGAFYRCWVAYLGLDLGLFERLRAAGHTGLSPVELAEAARCQRDPTDSWVRAAHAAELVEFDGERARLDDDVATILLDKERPEYLGGQFVATVVASMDYERISDFFRTGRPMSERPPRFHRAVEQVTAQDIAVFFQEGLAELPDLAADLTVGGRVLDVACGGGRWLVAVARRFPETTLVGVEIEPDSVARAMRLVMDTGLSDRIRIEAREIPTMPFDAEFDLVYFQDALHEMEDPGASLRAAWRAVQPDGRLIVLDWCLPSALDDYRSLQGELLWGIQIDELYQGTRMYTREGFEQIFRDAGLPAPTVLNLPSGASLFLARRSGANST